jgi:hypothetical protein
MLDQTAETNAADLARERDLSCDIPPHAIGGSLQKFNSTASAP